MIATIAPCPCGQCKKVVIPEITGRSQDASMYPSEAEQLVKRWNAFEEGGLIHQLSKLCDRERYMNLSLDDLKALREHAIKVGTLVSWSEVAVEWMETAQKKIEELRGVKNSEVGLGG